MQLMAQWQWLQKPWQLAPTALLRRQMAQRELLHQWSSWQPGLEPSYPWQQAEHPLGHRWQGLNRSTPSQPSCAARASGALQP